MSLEEGAALERIVEYDASFQTRSRFWYALPLGVGVIMLGFVLDQDTPSPLTLWVGGALGIALVAGRWLMVARKRR